MAPLTRNSETNPVSSVAGSDQVRSGSVCIRLRVEGGGTGEGDEDPGDEDGPVVAPTGEPAGAALGWEHEALAAYVEARQGYTFMLIYVPSHLDTERAMAVTASPSRSARRSRPPAYRAAGAAAAAAAAGAAGSAKVGVDLRISTSSAVMSTGISAKSGVVR